jgi:drug/metabolite transporter (DMT)-like permease
MSRPPLSIWIGLTIAVLLETITQLTWKLGTKDHPAPLELFLSPWFQLTVFLWIAQFFNWILVLARSDLSFAQPMTAFSYVTVALCAYFIFHEHITVIRGVGILLIVIGAWQMSATGHNTRETKS